MVGATAGVYKLKKKQHSRTLLIIFANLSEEQLILSPGQLVAEAEMCVVNEKSKSKCKINILSPSNPVLGRTEELWEQLS